MTHLYQILAEKVRLWREGLSDVPEKKNELIDGAYRFSAPPEFISFMTTGKPQLNPLYDRKGELVYSESKDWDLRRLACSHICFKFGTNCDACNRLDEGSAQQALKAELMACLGGKG